VSRTDAGKENYILDQISQKKTPLPCFLSHSNVYNHKKSFQVFEILPFGQDTPFKEKSQTAV
jgi:hypothetical protein